MTPTITVWNSWDLWSCDVIACSCGNWRLWAWRPELPTNAIVMLVVEHWKYDHNASNKDLQAFITANWNYNYE